MRELANDQVVDGRYQVLDHVGTGGMAEVYCAQDLQLGRRVALKILHRRFAEDEEFVERFRREASSAAGLQHQHVVSIYDRGEWDGTSYIAMEYVDGRTLKQLIQQEGPLEPAAAIDVAIQILRAARFAHRRGVIHRDLKPHNVILDEEGRAKVADFGIARAGASDMTQTGSIMGTAQYLSPEQAQGHSVSAQSDLYAIGIVLYEMLTGRVPFDADSAVTVALKQVNEVPPDLAMRAPAPLPQELIDIVDRALEKDPARRFADADEFIAALEAAASRLESATAATNVAGAGAAAVVAGGMAGAAVPAGYDTGAYAPAQEVYAEHEEVRAPDDERRRPRWPWALAAVLLAVGAVVAALLLSGAEQVAVPNVVGSDVTVATDRLERDGFDVTVVRGNSPQPRNTVIGQDPSGGATADEGSEVRLNVSDGPQIRAVPDVVGEGRRAARRTLTEAGFEVRERREPSADVRENRVVSQSPSGNGQAAEGSTITIVTSTGPEQVTVPDVVGRSEDDARAALEDAGLDVSVRPQESEDAEPGTVLEQDPAAGTEVARDSTVTIAVAEEPETTEVPDVVGRSQGAATETLSGQGFRIDVEETGVDTPSEDGIVQSQSPEGGGEADRGSSVTITVGRFEPDLNPDPQPGDGGAGGGTGPPAGTPPSP